MRNSNALENQLLKVTVNTLQSQVQALEKSAASSSTGRKMVSCLHLIFSSPHDACTTLEPYALGSIFTENLCVPLLQQPAFCSVPFYCLFILERGVVVASMPLDCRHVRDILMYLYSVVTSKVACVSLLPSLELAILSLVMLWKHGNLKSLSCRIYYNISLWHFKNYFTCYINIILSSTCSILLKMEK